MSLWQRRRQCIPNKTEERTWKWPKCEQRQKIHTHKNKELATLCAFCCCFCFGWETMYPWQGTSDSTFFNSHGLGVIRIRFISQPLIAVLFHIQAKMSVFRTIKEKREGDKERCTCALLFKIGSPESQLIKNHSECIPKPTHTTAKSEKHAIEKSALVLIVWLVACSLFFNRRLQPLLNSVDSTILFFCFWFAFVLFAFVVIFWYLKYQQHR